MSSEASWIFLQVLGPLILASFGFKGADGGYPYLHVGTPFSMAVPSS